MQGPCGVGSLCGMCVAWSGSARKTEGVRCRLRAAGGGLRACPGAHGRPGRGQRHPLGGWPGSAPGPTSGNGIPTPDGVHVGAERGIHVGLVSGALVPEPFEYIPVHSEGDGLLGWGDHHFRIVPEVVREIRQLGWRRAGDLRLSHSPKATQVCPSPTEGLLLRTPSGRLPAHACCSFGQR
jgi:hypothetical protein